MDKTVLNLDDLMVDSFTTADSSSSSDTVAIDYTGCMSECTAC